MEAFRQVGPGGHFLGCDHTQANFEKAFYRSFVADNNSVEQWEAEGRLDEAQRANAIWKKMLAEYEAAADRPGHRRGAPRLHRAQEGVDARRDALRPPSAGYGGRPVLSLDFNVVTGAPPPRGATSGWERGRGGSAYFFLPVGKRNVSVVWKPHSGPSSGEAR